MTNYLGTLGSDTSHREDKHEPCRTRGILGFSTLYRLTTRYKAFIVSGKKLKLCVGVVNCMQLINAASTATSINATFMELRMRDVQYCFVLLHFYFLTFPFLF
jgi:hypothetical protein